VYLPDRRAGVESASLSKGGFMEFMGTLRLWLQAMET